MITIKASSTNEIHDHKMENDAGKDKISKCSLWRNPFEVRIVGWVALHS